MPPKNKQTIDSLKQKSLMTWFSKDASSTTQTPGRQVGDRAKTFSSPLPPPSSSPESLKSTGMECDEDTVAKGPARKQRRSSVGSSSRERSTPPTSDEITDVDMLCIEDDEELDAMESEIVQARRVPGSLH
jgi:DNA mismatch repair protein MSH6